MRIENYIHGKDGNEKALCESLEYHGEWMGDEFVTVTVHSPEPVDFQIGDYLEYRNENFSILDDPNIIKKARSGSYHEGFTYENIKLYPESARMKHIAFNDYVLPDPDAPANKIPYSSLNIFSFFAASVEDLADRLQANLDRMEPGRWAVFTPSHNRTLQRVPSEISKWNNYYDGSYDVQGKTDVNVTVSGLSCWEALKLSYTSFDVSYYITGRIIVIGGTPISTEHDFRYGKGLGLYEIERTTDETQDVVTKLYCYGSEKNIPYGYYANLGKRIKFQIRQKSEREYIARNPRLLLWVETSYQDIKKAFNDTEMFEVELEYNGIRATFRGWGDTYNYASEKDDQTLDHETVYLNFYTHQDDSAGAAFFNSVPVGGYVYVTRGMNINKLSNAFVEIPQTYDYDAALSVNRLMLPGFPEQSLFDWIRTNGGTVLNNEKGIVGWKSWSFYASKDKKAPWIMSLKADSKGVREGTATFDESSGNEIYPTIEGTGLDVVSWAEQMDDNGYLGDEPKESEKVFKMQPSTISGYEIDWNDTDGEEVSISMKDGACVGREFKMKKAQRNEDTKLWELTLERFYDSSIGRYFPYNANASGDRRLYQVMGTGNWMGTKQGDHFVALGIKLPSSYVQLAAVKLLEESLKELAKIDHHRHTYVPKVDEIYMQRQDDFIRNEYRPGHPQTKDYGTVSIHDTLRAGMQIDMSDTDLGLDHYKPYIDVLTIKEDGNNGIPTYDVVMREEKELTLQERLQSQIDGGVKEYVNLTNKGTSVYGDYISKVYDDETEYLVKFLGGLMVDGSLKSPQYKEGEWEKVKDVDSGLWTQVHTGEGLGVYRGDDGGWHIELDYATIRKMLKTKELESLKAFFGSEDYYNPEESVLAVQGNAEFSDHLSSTVFQSGFPVGKGWAIKKVVFTNSVGEEETRYTLEIDNITVRNTLRVYEMIISQLRGENDNYLFAAMAEVHHYDPDTGKVWLSTDGGKIYMPFRPGDYIMVQRYMPGRTGISGKDGYVTKSYELVVVDCNAGGQEDENGDRLDWVIFKNFTTQMTHDRTDSEYYPVPAGQAGDYYHTEEEVEQRRDAVENKVRSQHPSWSDIEISDEVDKIMAEQIFLTPEELIEKGDTFCRLDNESDHERKGIIGITSVGPDTPYMDIMYGRKTDPDNFLKGRIGNLEGIKSSEFGWLEGFGAYLINLYSVGHFKNAQTGEAMESRIEATNERLRSVYREKGYDISEADNKVKNGFFQNGLDGWTACKIDGTALPAEAEMTCGNEYTDPETGKKTVDWQMTHSDGFEAYSIKTEGDPMLMNGLQLEIQKTSNVELTTSEGVQVLHLNSAGVLQDFSVMTANTAHQVLKVDDDTFDKPETDKPEYEKETYGYWEEIIKEEIKLAHDDWNTRQIEEEFGKEYNQTRIANSISHWQEVNEEREAALTEMEDENDKLYVGVRILPLTEGNLRIGFLEENNGVVEQWSNLKHILIHCYADTKWSIEQQNDHPENGELFYFPVDTDTTRKRGRLLISYDGECYIRFVVLQNNPIDEEQAEYETIFDQTSRRIFMQASKNQSETASWVIQHNAISQLVTDDRDNAETQIQKILGITINADGTYNFPDDWVEDEQHNNLSYGSLQMQTKNRVDALVAKWDDKGNLIGYSHHTQSADYIRDVIAATSYADYPQWVKDCLAFGRDGSDFYEAWKIAAANGGLSGSSVTSLKGLWNAVYNQFYSCYNTVSALTAEDINGYELAAGIFLSSHLLQTINNISLEMGNLTNGEAVDKDDYYYKELNFTDIPELVEAIKQFTDSVVSQCTDKHLAANVASVTADFEQYQSDLDDASKGQYSGNVEFLNWANSTAISYLKVLGALSKDGNLIDYSLVEQTAIDISTAVESISWQASYYDNISQWEDGTVNIGGTGGYEAIKADDTSQKRLVTTFGITPPSSLAKPNVIMSTSYRLLVVYFGKDDNKISSTSWLTPNNETGKIVLEVPNNTRSAAFVIKRSSGRVNIAEANVRLYIPTVDAGSYVSQTANAITQSVTNNKTAADTAIKNIRLNLYGDEDATTGQDGSLASWFTMKSGHLDLVAANFDEKGNVTVDSGIVVSAGSDSNAFATLFLNDLDSYMGLYFDGEIGESTAKIKADSIKFNFTTSSDWYWINENLPTSDPEYSTLIMKVDSNGLNVYGQIKSTQSKLYVTTLNSIETLSVQGDFTLDNAKQIKWKKSSGTTAYSMLTLDNRNNFIVGEAAYNNSIDTYIRGASIKFQTGTNYKEYASLSSSGVFKTTTLMIGDIYIGQDSNGNLEVYKLSGTEHVAANLYTRGAVSALGAGSSSGGGSGTFDEEQMWEALGVNEGTYKNRTIANGHLVLGLLTIKDQKNNILGSWNPKNGDGIITVGGGDFLPLDGTGTMTGTLNVKASQFADSLTAGALNMNNSNIYNVNGIYTCDQADSASEGLNFYRTSTTVDSFWISNGVMYFTPNRTLGTNGTSYTILHSNNGVTLDTAQTISGQKTFTSAVYARALILNSGMGGTYGYIDFYYGGGSSMTSNIYEPSSGKLQINSTLNVIKSGNVGIGTDSPSYKLDVSGTGRFTGVVDIDLTTAGSTVLGTQYPVIESKYKNAAGTEFGYSSLISLIGSGETSTCYNMGVRLGSQNGMTWLSAGESGATLSSVLTSMCNTENVYISADNNICMITGASNDSASYTIAMDILSNGNVGIGTSNPGAKLHVNGSLKASLFLSSHNAGGTSGSTGLVNVAKITVVSAWASQPLKFRVTQRGRMGAELTVSFLNANSAAGTTINEFYYTGDIAGASIVQSGTEFYLYIQKAEAYDSIGISLVDLGSYANGTFTIEWRDVHYSTAPGATVATCRYYFASNVYMEYDTAKAGVRVVNAGIYANTYVSSLGAGSSGEGGSTNLMYPLSAINEANLSTSPAQNSVIMYDGSKWKYSVINASGTVTRVDMSMPSGFTVSGGPILTNGTLSVKFGGSVTANCILASPNGSAGAPSWRALAAEDIPYLSWNKITTDKPTTLSGYGISESAITAGKASQLAQTIQLWGNPFNGTQNIGYINSDTGATTTANLNYVKNISMAGTVTGCTSIDQMLYFSTTNSRIGIGTSNPGTKLDVVGQMRLRQNESSTTSLQYGVSSDTIPFIRFTDPAGGTVDIMVETSTGTTTTYPLRLGSTSRQTRIYGSNVRLFTAESSSSTSLTEALRAAYGGRVLIGGTDANDTNCKLCVNGNICTSTTDQSYIKIGGAKIIWDNAKQALHIDKGVWADSFVSSLGTGSGGSGGGSGDYIPLSGSTSISGTMAPSNSDISLGTNTNRWYVNGSTGNFSNNVTAANFYVGTNLVLHAGNARNYAVGLRSYDNNGATDLSSVSNLNAILAAGTYCCRSAANKDNQPLRGIYRLWHIVNTGTDNNSSQDSVQIALYTNSARMYLRSHTSSGFGDWVEMATTGTAVTLSATQTISGAKAFTGGVTANALSISNGGTLSVIGSASTLAIKGESINNAATTLAIQGSGSTKDLTLCAGGGTVIIGSTSAPTNVLSTAVVKVKGAVATTLGCYHGSTEYDESDIRKKDVIDYIDDLSVEKIARAPLFRFTWKDGRDTKIHAGTSAQYWLGVLPEVIGGIEEDNLYLSYSTTALAAAVMTARTVLSHEERIKALEAENERLRTEIEQLKAA